MDYAHNFCQMDPLQGDSVIWTLLLVFFLIEQSCCQWLKCWTTVGKRSVQQGNVYSALLVPSFSRRLCVEFGIFHANIFLLKRIKMQWLCWLTLNQPTHENPKWCYQDDVFFWYDYILQSFQFFPFSFCTVQDCLPLFSTETLVEICIEKVDCI